MARLLARKVETRTEGTQQVEVRLGGEIIDLLRESKVAAEEADKVETVTLREDDSEERLFA